MEPKLIFRTTVIAYIYCCMLVSPRAKEITSLIEGARVGGNPAEYCGGYPTRIGDVGTGRCGRGLLPGPQKNKLLIG